MKICTIEGCEVRVKAKGLCNTHYMQARRAMFPAPRMTATDRFWAKVDKSVECWEWKGSKSGGYGFLCENYKSIRAHRFSYELHHGPISEGMLIDHICRNPGCVNPAHLRQVTQKQNLENLDGPHRSNVTSGARGVYKRSNGNWQARTSHNGRIYTAGDHATIEEADAAVVALRNRLHTHNDADRRDS